MNSHFVIGHLLNVPLTWEVMVIAQDEGCQMMRFRNQEMLQEAHYHLHQQDSQEKIAF